MDQLAHRLDDVKLLDNGNNAATTQSLQIPDVESSEKWGMPLGDLYRLGLSFFKGELSLKVNCFLLRLGEVNAQI